MLLTLLILSILSIGDSNSSSKDLNINFADLNLELFQMVLKWNPLFYRLACRESKVEWIIPMLHLFEPCRRDDQAKIIEKSEL